MYLAQPALRSLTALLNNIHPMSEILQFRCRGLHFVVVILVYLSVFEIDNMIHHVLYRVVVGYDQHRRAVLLVDLLQKNQDIS